MLLIDYHVLLNRRRLLTDSILGIGAIDRDAATEILLCAHDKAIAEKITIGAEWVESMQELLREEDEKHLDLGSCSAVQ